MLKRAISSDVEQQDEDNQDNWSPAITKAASLIYSCSVSSDSTATLMVKSGMSHRICPSFLKEQTHP